MFVSDTPDEAAVRSADSGGEFGRSTQQSSRSTQRSLGFHQGTRDVVVLCDLIAGHEITHLLLVTVDVVGHHGQSYRGVRRHGAQSAVVAKHRCGVVWPR